MMNNTMNAFSILVVDDEPNNFDVIEALLSGEDYQLHYCSNGQAALERLVTVQPDLILLDVMMPKMNGIEVCRRIKAMPAWREIPIIMVTALTEKKDLANCLSSGADDFIRKRIIRLELTARVRSMLRIREQYRQLAQFNAELEENVQQRTARLRTLIFEDELTGLPSRMSLMMVLAKELQLQNSPFALLYIDCDQFKLINGSFGYDVGDQLLVAISERLKEHLQPNDMLARIGEDEFCFLIYGVESLADIEPFILGVRESFDRSFSIAECDLFITACMGVSLSCNVLDKSPQSKAHERLLQDADTAMYQAKRRGKGSYQLFDAAMHVETVRRLTLENDLQRALKNEEFVVHYQPIIDIQTQHISGFEALVRWQHPTRGMVSPAEFIPIMEMSGLIVPLGFWVLEQSCRQLQSWQRQGHRELTMSVNLSVRQFTCPSLLAEVDRILAKTNVNPTDLKLEITESAIMEDAERAILLTQALRSRGICISMDDFGTGYSSLGYLHRFPLDALKIEGIETSAQLEWLQESGCKYAQGYFFARPMCAAEIERKDLLGNTWLARIRLCQGVV